MKPKQPLSPERAAAIEELKQKWIRKNQVKKPQVDKKQKDEPKKK